MIQHSVLTGVRVVVELVYLMIQYWLSQISSLCLYILDTLPTTAPSRRVPRSMFVVVQAPSADPTARIGCMSDTEMDLLLLSLPLITRE